MRRAFAAAVLVIAMSACGSNGRNDARNDLIDQLVESGLDRTIADCVVTGFFDERSDQELKDFFDRPALTDDERADFARLTEACTSLG